MSGTPLGRTTRTVYELLCIPDMTLPKYLELFGEEAHESLSTRIYRWYVSLASADGTQDGQGSGFTLRYVYDVKRMEPNRRLRVYVLVDSHVERTVFALALRSARLALQLEEVSAEDVMPSLDDWQLARLECTDHVIEDNKDLLLLPAVGRAGAGKRAEASSGHGLDEAFAVLESPAVLEIQLHRRSVARLRQALWAAMALTRSGATERPYNAMLEHHYQGLLNSIEAEPVARFAIHAASPEPGAAAGLLMALGLRTFGSGCFQILEGAGVDIPVREAFVSGNVSFTDNDGWYKPKLREIVAEQSPALNAMQQESIRALSELSVLAGPELARELLRIPVPAGGYLRTLPLETEVRTQQNLVAPTSKKGELVLGADLERGSSVSVPLSDLTRHVFVAGVTGSGKTRTIVNLLRQLAEQDIPFLVLEPAKAEYRAMLRLQPPGGLRVYTPGRDELSPLRVSPFALAAETTLREHIPAVVAAFSTSLGLFHPLPAILEETIWRMYEEYGWHEDSTCGDKLRLPRLRDLPSALETTIHGLGYAEEVSSNFRAAFRARLTPFTRGATARVFDCQTSDPSMEELCRQRSLIELRSLSLNEANLVTMTLMVALRQQLRTPTSGIDKPRFALILEEAHNLVPAADQESGEEGRARAEASRYVANMLAEMRALGLAIFVIDQTPAAVDKQVVRNTNLKVAHRTVAKEDRETLAASMLMDEARCELLGRLSPGEAYIYSQAVHRPRLVQCALVNLGEGFESVVTDEELRGMLAGQDWYKATVRRRVGQAEAEAESLHSFAMAVSEVLSDASSTLQDLLRASNVDDSPTVGQEVESWRNLLKGQQHSLTEIAIPAARSLGATHRAIESAARLTRLVGREEKAQRKKLQSLIDSLEPCLVSLSNSVSGALTLIDNATAES